MNIEKIDLICGMWRLCAAAAAAALTTLSFCSMAFETSHQHIAAILGPWLAFNRADSYVAS